MNFVNTKHPEPKEGIHESLAEWSKGGIARVSVRKSR